MEMLDPSADEIRDWGNSVIQFMTDYLGDLRARPVYRHTSSHEIRSGLDATLPIEGTDFDSLLKVFCDTIVPFSRQNAHPRMRILPAKRNDRVAKNFQKRIKIGSLDWKSGVKPASNFV